jgi:hypothetical protein
MMREFSAASAAAASNFFSGIPVILNIRERIGGGAKAGGFVVE